MAQKAKKAKLAHEKNRGQQAEEHSSFSVSKVIELVDEAGGKRGAVVELDEKGTLAIVDVGYVVRGSDGNYAPRRISCPACYDTVAQERAIARYQAHAGA